MTTKKKRILYTVPSYPTGKHHGFIDEISELQRLGYEVFIAPIWESFPENKVDSLKIDIIYNPNLSKYMRFFYCTVNFTKRPIQSIKFIWNAKKFIGYQESYLSLHLLISISNHKPDRIHSYFANNAALKVLLIAEHLNIQFSCSGRGTDVLIKRIPEFLYLVNHSKPFFTLSEYNKSVIEKIPGVNIKNVKVIHHGIQIENYPKRDWDNIHNDIPVILSITWFRKVKGVEYLIEACNILKNKGIDFFCKIIGDGYLRPKIEDMITHFHLEKYVYLYGRLDHQKVIDHLLKSDIFVLPSLSEGIAISAMEAMTVGLPVIVTEITGMNELIDNNETGLVVRPKNPVDLSNAIDKLLKDNNLCMKLGNSTRRKIKSDFNIKNNIQIILKFWGF